MLWVSISTSTKTGIAPNWIIGFTVVGKPAATPIISSPFFIDLSPSFGDVRVLKANKLAEEFKKINDVTKIKIKIVKCDISKKNTDVGFILKKNIKKLWHY